MAKPKQFVKFNLNTDIAIYLEIIRETQCFLFTGAYKILDPENKAHRDLRSGGLRWPKASTEKVTEIPKTVADFYVLMADEASN